MPGDRRKRSRTGRSGQDGLTGFLADHRLSGLRYHCRLAQHLTRNGFEVCQIERQHNHADVWVLRLRRGQVPLGREIDWLQHHVCLFLRRHGLRYPKKEVVVMVQGNRIKAAFNWSRGQPGWLSYTRPKAGRRNNHPT